VSEPVRAFVAIELTDEARSMLVQAESVLESVAPGKTRFVPPENLHLSLKFLGDLPQEAIPRLVRALSPRVGKSEPFDVELGGFGAFPNARAARVVWIGVTDGGAPLARLARHVEAAAGRVGVARERRPFRGHLTLARLGQPGPIPIERLETPAPVRIPVREIVLFQSDLSPAGARYSALTRLPLGKGGAEADVEHFTVHPEG
jgi:2'-5' RNA ligase